VRLILVPTTLLAQVDAALGGKVGVDAVATKNLVGAFYPAEHVVIDPDLLATLPAARLSEGLAEIVKIAMMRSPELLGRLQHLQAPQDVLQNPDIVRQAASEKMAVVTADPFEQNVRALLNFGHTVGHGIEAASGYRVSHGQAVAAGMAAETYIGEELSATERGTRDLVISLMERFDLSVTVGGIDAGAAFQAMLGDKKRRRGILHMAIPCMPGTGTVVPVADDLARAGLHSVLGPRA
jgi:3-dehydroquinate synthetase